MVSSFVVAVGFFIARKHGRRDRRRTCRCSSRVAVTTVVWVAVTLADAADRCATLDRVLPARPPRRPAGRPSPAAAWSASPDSLPQALLGWVLGCAFVYARLFGTGSLLYGNMPAVRDVARRVRGRAAPGWRACSAAAGLPRRDDRRLRRRTTQARDPRARARHAHAAGGAAARSSTRSRRPRPTRAMKAMIPIGRPFLDYVLSALADAGLRGCAWSSARSTTCVRRYYARRRCR